MNKNIFTPVHQDVLAILKAGDGAVDEDSGGVPVPLEGVVFPTFWEELEVRPRSPEVFTGQESRTSSPALATNSSISAEESAM